LVSVASKYLQPLDIAQHQQSSKDNSSEAFSSIPECVAEMQKIILDDSNVEHMLLQNHICHFFIHSRR
jgi:hypothetical protein